MGRSKSFALAYHKALEGAGIKLPTQGKIFITVRNDDKAEAMSIAEQFINLGFKIVATQGTAKFMNENGLVCERVNKLSEGGAHCVQAIKNGEYALLINTVSDETAVVDGYEIRRAALERKIPYSTVLSSAWAMMLAIEKTKAGVIEVTPLTSENR